MAVPGLGHRSYMALSLPETTFGTYKAPVKKYEIISFEMNPDQSIIEDPSLYNAVSLRGIYQGGLLYRGKAVVRMNYEGMIQLIRMATGVTGYSKAAAVENVVHDHTMKESFLLPSHTIEVSEGDVETGKVQRVLGTKCSELVIRGTAGQGLDAMLQAELTLLARDKIVGQTPTTSYIIAGVGKTVGTPNLTGADFIAAGLTVGSPVSGTNIPAGATIISIGPLATNATMSANALGTTSNDMTVELAFPTLTPVLFHEAITFNDGVHTLADVPPAAFGYMPKAFELTLTNQLIEDRFRFGTVNAEEAIRGARLAVRWRFTTEYTDDAYLANVKTFANVQPKIVMQHPALISASHRREWEFHSNSARQPILETPIAGWGVIEQSHTILAINDTAEASAFVLRNKSLDAS